MYTNKLTIAGIIAATLLSRAAAAQTSSMQQLLTRYADQRFGMFIHYNMNTY